MLRRDFLSVLGSAAAWPLAAQAQQPAVPVVGLFFAGQPETYATTLAAFRRGLSEVGFVEGRNLTIEYRWANNDRARLPELAADLVRRNVNVIAAPQLSAALAAKAATTTIPIVFQTGGDPVEVGLVASFNRPGGNLTGTTTMGQELTAKRFALLHELKPDTAPLALLTHPANPNLELLIRESQAAAASFKRPIEVMYASTRQDIDMIFASLAQKRIGGLAIPTENFLTTRRVQTATLAIRHSIPTIYGERADAAAGGLMSYGTDSNEQSRQVGVYVGRILNGEKPGDLPIARATKFQFVINLQTATTIGINVPPGLLAIADEVIE